MPRLPSATVLIVLAASVGMHLMPACGQSATDSIIKTESRGFTASNSSGFSFHNNGTFAYSGPLNERRDLPFWASTTLEYDGRTILITPEDALIQARMPQAQGPGTTLNSTQLPTGQIPSTGGYQNVQIGYTLILPAITQVKGNNATTHVQQVDGQSLSVFPSITPSVFP